MGTGLVIAVLSDGRVTLPESDDPQCVFTIEELAREYSLGESVVRWLKRVTLHYRR